MVHVLEWTDAWYAKCAEAQVSELCNFRVVENTKVQSAFEGQILLANLIKTTEDRIHSSSVGHNLMQDATIAASVKGLRQLPIYDELCDSRSQIFETWRDCDTK